MSYGVGDGVGTLTVQLAVRVSQIIMRPAICSVMFFYEESEVKGPVVPLAELVVPNLLF